MKSNGFTLIETLIVLSIVAIVSSGSFILMKPSKNSLENHLFLTQFQSDLYIAQQNAISHQREVSVTIVPEQNYYYFREYNGKLILKRSYSPNITFKTSSLPWSFKFLPDGNVNQFGILYFQIGKKAYKLTMQLGKGRFYVEEA